MSLVWARSRRRGLFRVRVSDFQAHSFESFRERPAPTALRGRSLSGEERTVQVSRPTLVVAIKPHCDGCHDFVHGDLRELEGVEVVVVSATTGDDAEWDDAIQPILVAPDLMNELDIRSAPFYILINPKTSLILGEGAVFSSAQVAREIAPFLDL